MEMEREQKQKKAQPSNSMKGKEHQSNVLQCPQGPDVLTTTADTISWSPPQASSPTIQQLSKSNSKLEKLMLQMQKEMIEMKTLPQGSRTWRDCECRGPQLTVGMSNGFCQACKRTGQRTGCEHCINCGQSGHLARY